LEGMKERSLRLYILYNRKYKKKKGYFSFLGSVESEREENCE